MKMLKTLFSILLLTTVVAITGCSDDEDPLVPFTVNFSTTEVGISSTSPEAEITINFSRPSTLDGNILLSLEPGTLTYGEMEDFYTSVTPVNNVITLPFVSGDQSVSFTVFAGSAAAIEEDKTLGITIAEDTGTIFSPGLTNQLSVTFAENFISPGAVLSVNVTSSFTQRGYIDLSKADFSVVEFDNYDLGFQNGDGFYVTLNGSAKTMARPLSKNNLNEVTASDTVGFAVVMKIPAPNFDPSSGSVAWIDTPDGNLETTAFGEISAIDEDNVVFIIKRDNGNWKKVRVLRSTDGYVLQHADISATSFQTINISKNDAYESVTVDLDQGIVEATPENARWDFMYGKYTEILNLGGPGADIPYEFNDYIISNRSDVSVAMVMTENETYADFTAEDATGLTFASEINALGSQWRQGGGPSSAPAVFQDRFFVLKDGEDNMYKILFTDMYSDTDERGEISFTYELLN